MGVSDGGARKRMLMIAYACSPVRGSEHGVGWGRATQAGLVMDTWVICGDESRADIEQYCATHGPVPGVRFLFAGPSRTEDLLERHLPGPFRHNYLAYGLWHRRAYRLAQRLHAEMRFDVVHQANTCGYREPGYLWKLDAPFVWGPIGGTQNYPWRFLREAGVRGAMLEGARTVANVIQLRCSPRVRRAMRRATILLAANSTGVRDIERTHGRRPVRLLETGLRTVAQTARTFSGDRPLRLLWSGELKPNKGLHLLLAALGALGNPDAFTLRVLGTGPAERSLRRSAERFGLATSCEWLGWQPFAQASAQYDWADALVFTSLRDTSGNVMLEAMAKGVPVICLDHQGAADIVTASCGFKIPVTSPRRVIAALRDVVHELTRDRTALTRRSPEAISRARAFLWEENGRAMAEVYKQVVGGMMAIESAPVGLAARHVG